MIEVERRGRIAVITMNRPERRNALTGEACEVLAAAVTDAHLTGARAVVLTGAGTNFCAGADLQNLGDEGFAAQLRGALVSLRDAPVTTMAAVHGAALGAGTQLALACDLRVVAPDARFAIPAAKLGLMVDQWTVRRVALLAGNGTARALLLAAEEVDAAHALGLGLASRAGVLEEALEWAASIAELAPLAVAGHKLALNRLEPDLEDAEVAAAFRRAWASHDLVEGRAAFAEKRPPRFEGR